MRSPGQGACTTTSSRETCEYTFTIIHRNVQGISVVNKLEIIVDMTITKGINGYSIQETWKLRVYTTTIREHIIFRYVMEENNNNKGRIISGISIILGPALLQAWTRSRKPAPITSQSNYEFPGRMIGVALSFRNKYNISKDRYHWKAKGKINSFFALSTIQSSMLIKESPTKILEGSIQISRLIRKCCLDKTQLERGHLFGDVFICFRDQWHR